jgi:glyoxylase-like metal-dependent hydrolase (beta-lactamase superfamily II)
MRILTLALAIPLTLEAQTGRALVQQVAGAMGGVENVMGVHTLTLRGTGENYNLGQNRTPESELPLYVVTKYIRVFDFQNRRWRQDQTREPRFPTGNTAPQRQRTGLDSVAYDITSDTTMRRLGSRATIDRRAELIYHPIGFVQAALQRNARIVEERQRDRSIKRVHLDWNGERYTMTIDARTLLPIQIDRKIPNAMLGDVVISNEFPLWYVADNVRVPLEIVQRLDGRWEISDMRFDGFKVNGDVGNITIPASVRDAELVNLPVTVTVDSIAPGVWYIGGGSHNSVAIAMKDHMVLVEAPQSDERTLAVINRVRQIDSARPLTTVINTHHHFDHAGGIRAAVAEGLTVITHNENVSFYRNVVNRKFTIIPDELARSPRPPVFEGVTDHRVITDGTRNIELYEVKNAVHSSTMLIVYLPKERILVEADLYTPPATNVTTPVSMPFIANLADNISRLGLQVDRIIPIHGRVVTMDDFRTALAGAQKQSH